MRHAWDYQTINHGGTVRTGRQGEIFSKETNKFFLKRPIDLLDVLEGLILDMRFFIFFISLGIK